MGFRQNIPKTKYPQDEKFPEHEIPGEKVHGQNVQNKKSLDKESSYQLKTLETNGSPTGLWEQSPIQEMLPLG